MTVKELLLLLLGGILVNNYVFENFLGAETLLGFAGKKGKTVGMGVAVAVVILLSSALTWLCQTFVLRTLAIGYMQTLVFVAIILAVVYLVQLLSKALLHSTFGVYFPLIALNSAVLGCAVNNVSAGYTFLQALLTSLGVGLGFLGGLVVFSGVMSRIDTFAVPKAFRGLPISLLAASIVSMALLAFA